MALASDTIKISEGCFFKIEDDEFVVTIEAEFNNQDTFNRDYPRQESKEEVFLESASEASMHIEENPRMNNIKTPEMIIETSAQNEHEYITKGMKDFSLNKVSVEKSAELSVPKSAEMSVGKSIEISFEKSVDKSAEKSVAKNGDTKILKKSATKNAEPKIVEKFVEKSVANDVDKVIEKFVKDNLEKNMEKKSSNDVWGYFEELFDDKMTEEKAETKRVTSYSEPTTIRKELKTPEGNKNFVSTERIKKSMTFATELSPNLPPQNDSRRRIVDEAKSSQNSKMMTIESRKKSPTASQDQKMLEESKKSPESNRDSQFRDLDLINGSRFKSFRQRKPFNTRYLYEKEASKSDGGFEPDDHKFRFDEEEDRWSHDEFLDYRNKSRTSEFVVKDVGTNDLEEKAAASISQEEKILKEIEFKFSPFKGHIKKIANFIDLLFGDNEDGGDSGKKSGLDVNSGNGGDSLQKKIKK